MKRPPSKPILLLLFLIAAAIEFPLLPGPRAWPRGAWDAADHDGDGVVTREEMRRFGTQKPHRDAPRLMRHFEAADTNRDGRVDAAEVEAYGTEIGSRDPAHRQPSSDR